MVNILTAAISALFPKVRGWGITPHTQEVGFLREWLNAWLNAWLGNNFLPPFWAPALGA